MKVNSNDRATFAIFGFTVAVYIVLGLMLIGLLSASKADGGVLGTNGVYTISNAPAEVTLAWNVDTSPGVVGYNIYQGVASRTYTNMIDAGNATSIAVSIQRGITNYFAVTAYTSSGLESQFSNEVTYDDTNNIPVAPSQKPPVLLIAQQNINGRGWQNVYALSVDPSVAPMSEFRLQIAYSPPPGAAPSPLVVPMKASPVPMPPQPQVLPTTKGKMTIYKSNG